MINDVSSEKWFRGSRDEREVPILIVIDRHRGWNGRLCSQSMRYVPSAEETQQVDFSKLLDQTIDISVQTLKFDRDQLKVTGAIDYSTIPAQARKNGNGGASPSSTPPKKAA